MLQYALFNKYYTPSGMEIDLSNYYTKSEVDNLLDAINISVNKLNNTCNNIYNLSLQTEFIDDNNFVSTFGNNFTSQMLEFTFGDSQISIKGKKGNKNYQNIYNISSSSSLPKYIETGNDGEITYTNIVKVGEFDDYDILSFYIKVLSLPNNGTKEIDLSTILDSYDIHDFIDVHGITSSGHFINNGRSDNTSNVVIVQQASKNRKSILIRDYADLSNNSARIYIEFIGQI